MRTSLLALLFTACAATPPPVMPVAPEPLPPPPAAPPPSPLVTALPSMLPAGQSAMPEMPAMAPVAAPVATPLAAPLAQNGALEHAMRNCPTAIAGAITAATNTASGVDLTITVSDPIAQRRLIELSGIHETMGDPETPALRHTGRHGGPGTLGRCPVIHDGTTVTFTKLRKGVVIHLRALLPSDVARVQQIVADRLAAIAAR